MKNKLRIIRTITAGELMILFVLFLIMALIGFTAVAFMTSGWFGIILLTILGIYLIIKVKKMSGWLREAFGLKTSQNRRRTK